MKKTTILIADDHEVVRSGLAAIFGFQPDLEVVGAAENGLEAVRLARQLKPDVVIMDLVMPELDGVAATRRITEDDPSVRILILTTYASSLDLKRALDAGAAGAISKDCPNKTLIDAIRTIVRGGRAVSPDIENQLADLAEIPFLTDRQLDILASLTRGHTNQDIALRFAISEDTVKAHLKSLFAKLGVSNRTEAAAYALNHQLIR